MSGPPPARMALALAIGAAGGLAFFLLRLPLPWMLGALVAVMSAAVARLPVAAPERIRPATVAVIGVLLGSGFTPDLASRLPAWAATLAALAVYLALSGAAAVWWYRRAGFDPMTAFFAGMPGGIVEMVALGRAAGGDERRIILAHAARIVVTVAAVAVWFRLIEGHAVGADPGGTPHAALAARDAALLVLCGVAGALAGGWLRLPAPALLGPMLLSGGVHLAGLTDSAPPAGLVIAAQVILGTAMGGRFAGTAPAELRRALGLAAGATAITLALALAFALALHAALGIGAEAVMLAFAPGGLTEMSLVALAIGAEVAFVATHHVVRIVLLIAVAPLVFRRRR
jgi:hypothetical protein